MSLDSILLQRKCRNKVIADLNLYFANLGEAWLSHPLDHARKMQKIDDTERVVILISNGKIVDYDLSIKSIKQHTKISRFIALGIGKMCNKTMLNEIASLGYGRALYVQNEDSIPEIIKMTLRSSSEFCI